MSSFTKKDRIKLISALKDMYEDFSSESLQHLGDIYHPEITFQDPILQVNGIDELEKYFAHGMANAQLCHFAFDSEQVNKESAFLVWQMRLQHERLADGREILVQGCTHLEFSEDENKIRSHVDYYDLGAMVYEHVPVIGYLIRKVRDRLQAV